MRAAPRDERTTRATVFGLDVRSRIELPFLEGAAAQPTGRLLDVSAGSNEAADVPWRGSVEPLCDQRDAQGEVVLRIEAHPREGYLLWGAGHGAYLLDAGGRRLRCGLRGCRAEAWQRLLVAQALPFAALLQGLEALHASAVGWEHSFEALDSARSLLSSSFNFVLDQPERLRRLLHTCALAARCRVERVLCGADANATDVAQAIMRRLQPSP